jgi:hypothetical protein
MISIRHYSLAPFPSLFPHFVFTLFARPSPSPLAAYSTPALASPAALGRTRVM